MSEDSIILMISSHQKRGNVALRVILVYAILSLATLALSISNTTLDETFLACLPQMKIGEAQVPTAVYEDCIKIILGFTTGRRPTEPAIFSRNTWSGVRLPQKGIHGHCVFELDMHNDAAEEIASTLDVAREAGKMAKECVLKEPRTGGVARVGEHNRIEIILHGLTSDSGTPDVMAGWEHIGCEAAASTTSLSASMMRGNQVKLEDCAEQCTGYQYLGTRFGTQCFCGNTVATISSTGNSTLFSACGDPGSMNVYGVRGTTASA